MRKRKTIFSSATENWRLALRDLKAAGKELVFLPFIFLPLNSDSSVRSEMRVSSYGRLSHFLTVLMQAIVHYKRKPFSMGEVVCDPESKTDDRSDSVWYFINGITAAPPAAILHATEIANQFNRPIHLLHTPTWGVLWDLWQCFRANTLKIHDDLTGPSLAVIKKALQTREKVVVVCYSQGTVTSSLIVEEFLKDEDIRPLLHKLEVYNFAPLSSQFSVDKGLSREHGRNVPYVEHFANSGDPAAKIGVLRNGYKTDGALFLATDKKGHLLNDHYLGGVGRGEYCQGKSRLSKYLGGAVPTAADYASKQAG